MPITVHLYDLAVDSDQDAERCLWEALHQQSGRDVSIYAATMATSTHLIKPAALLGLNHCPKFFPHSYPAKAICAR